MRYVRYFRRKYSNFRPNMISHRSTSTPWVSEDATWLKTLSSRGGVGPLWKSLHPSLSVSLSLSNTLPVEGCLSHFPSNWSWQSPAVSWPPSLLPLLVWVPSHARPACWCWYLVCPGYDPASCSVFSWSAVTFSLVLLFTMGLRLVTWYPVNKFVELSWDASDWTFVRQS